MATIDDLITAVGELQDAVTILQNSVTDVTDVILVRKSMLDDAIDNVNSVVNSINAVLIQDLGSITGTVAINLDNGTLIKATLTGAVTLSFTGLPDSTSEKAFTLRFSGLEEINFPVGTLFGGGVAPDPEGTLYDLPCSISSAGVVIVYGIINDIS